LDRRLGEKEARSSEGEDKRLAIKEIKLEDEVSKRNQDFIVERGRVEVLFPKIGLGSSSAKFERAGKWTKKGELSTMCKKEGGYKRCH